MCLRIGINALTCRVSKLGLEPKLKTDLAAGKKYPYVLFSAPPSGAADYPAEVCETVGAGLSEA